MTEEEAEKRPNKLTRRRYLFCLQYIIDYDGKRAATDAGYSRDRAQVEASELLKLPIIQKTINELDNDRLAALRITGEKVIKGIDDIRAKALKAKDLPNALRALELLGRNKLWEKGGGVFTGKATINSESVIIEISQGEISAKDIPA